MKRDGLMSELAALCRGRGLHNDQIAAAIGPELRISCGVSAEDRPAVVRQKVQSRITTLAEQMPPDLKLVALASFGLHPVAVGRFLRVRLQRVSEQLQRDERTVRRYADQALRLMTDLLAAADATPLAASPTMDRSRTGWVIEEFAAVFRLDGARPEAYEHRAIVAVEDGLSRVVAAVSLPRPPADVVDADRHVDLDILYGGRVTRRDRLGPSHLQWGIELAEPVPRGGRHEYGLRYVLPDARTIVPRYVFVPMHPCHRFRLVARFPTNGNSAPRRLDGVPPRVLDDLASAGEAAKPDRFGELAMEFRDLRQGLAYGVNWQAW
ncbi:hypothetical protein ACPXB5_20805 [Micromonospora arida]|uniref:hypothetical protein n=1 Tax=Micromonospora arida TaxID=2203715 RepID=UPI003CF6E904